MNIRSIGDLGQKERVKIFQRDAGIREIRGDVDQIIERVQEEGDTALRAFSREFDDVEVGNIDITDEMDRAADELTPELKAAIETAAENIQLFHEAQLPEDWIEEFSPGRYLGRRFQPLERVGAYVPGGTAAYPSSALMTAIPAKVAGVEFVSVATPPGNPVNPITLAALSIAGVNRVYQVGGAQAIGALAYGTETVKQVQKIVGPGNRWVTAGKERVRGDVDIDFLAGPSEILTIVDKSANLDFVVADLLAQAEHDPNSPVAAVTTDATVANQIAEKVIEAQGNFDRVSTIEKALSNPASGIFIARSMSEVLLFAKEYAPEHLSIQTEKPDVVLDAVSNAGSVFIGSYTPVAAGDYASGTNHVLPTNGQAKITGGLSVDSFLKAVTVQELNKDGLRSIANEIQLLAEVEGLSAHAASVSCRFEMD